MFAIIFKNHSAFTSTLQYAINLITSRDLITGSNHKPRNATGSASALLFGAIITSRRHFTGKKEKEAIEFAEPLIKIVTG